MVVVTKSQDALILMDHLLGGCEVNPTLADVRPLVEWLSNATDEEIDADRENTDLPDWTASRLRDAACGVYYPIEEEN